MAVQKPPHPLSSLSIAETARARDVVLKQYPDTALDFRAISMLEPLKSEVLKFLELEHSGQLTPHSVYPARQAQVNFDVRRPKVAPEYTEAVVDLSSGKVVSTTVVPLPAQPALTFHELSDVVTACKKSTLLQKKLAEIQLPEGFEVVIEPWPYGASDPEDVGSRYFQGLLYASDKRKNNEDTNFYAYPIPLIPVMSGATKEIIRVDEIATGGIGDSLTSKSSLKHVLDHCASAEYVPELLSQPTRSDVRDLHIVQPDGPSFTVTDGNLVQWQKWSFRVVFEPKEGAVLSDIRYDGRSVLYRLSMSDMTVPYADPRSPFHRKQAFDFGDGGVHGAMNSLALGCDCLGLIHYFDGVTLEPNGAPELRKNVICMHEQDNGVGWKHTNWRTGRPVSTRRRELVIQYTLTLANYDYVFAFKFDQVAGIEVEVRATGIVSVINIDAGKKSAWGNVVSPGALAQNHQHIFCVRIDPAIDGHKNTLVQEESLPAIMDKRTNPNGNYYEVRQTPITTSVGLDANPFTHRVFKIQNTSKLNPISGKPVAYKITPPATQLLLADPKSIQSKRALFAQHHLWVTKHRDQELYAGGRYTFQSTAEVGGVADAAARNDDVLDEDIVLWSVFGLTHNPRVEDWPVMPVEMLRLNITPSDFFTGNPAIDVPPTNDKKSVLFSSCCAAEGADEAIANGTNGTEAVNGH